MEQHRETVFNRLILVISILTFCLVLGLAMSSCTVMKHRNRSVVKTDSIAVVNTQDITDYTNQETIDTTVYTDADTLIGEVNLSDTDKVVLESDDIKTTIEKKNGKYKITSTAKAKAVKFKTNKTETYHNTNNTQSNISLQKKVVEATKVKKTNYTPLIITGVIIFIILCIVVYKWLKSYRNKTKDILGI